MPPSANDVSQQLHSVMASAKQFLTTAIADNRTQMEAINDVADRSEAGVDPKLLIESLINELAKATDARDQAGSELRREDRASSTRSAIR